MNRKVLKTSLTVISLLLIISGISILVFPYIDNALYNNQQNNIISDFDNMVRSIKKNGKNKEKSHKDETSSKKYNIDSDRLLSDIKEYNKQIYNEGQSNLIDRESYQKPVFNLQSYGFPNNIYGYLRIKTLDLNMAIYLGASDSNMSLGAAQMTQTSIPLGGRNTNSVIAGHCGFGGRNYFRYIENLSNDDVIEIQTPFNKLQYKVVNKQIIKPNDLDKIKIQKNKDMITLFTCYPYPTSKYRCCVFCERN